MKRLLRAATGRTAPAQLIDQADAARGRGDAHTAMLLYDLALSADPANAALWGQLGNMAKDSGNFERAEQAYRAALDQRPDDSDLHLQLGHLYKLMERNDRAAVSYARSFALDSANGDAFAELCRLGRTDEARELAARASAATAVGDQLLVDVSDLIQYIGHHRHLSGIQRAQRSIILELLKGRFAESAQLQFVTFDRSIDQFRMIRREPFLALLEAIGNGGCDFDCDRARNGLLFAAGPLLGNIGDGNLTLLMLGTAWTIGSYARTIAELKRDHEFRFVMTFYDFIPVYAPETCDDEVRGDFARSMREMIPLVDRALCISKHCASDLQRFCGDNAIPIPPLTVTRLGANVETPSVADPDLSPPFVLFVSTIEGRKNHLYALQIWQRLIEHGVDVPRLLCVGRLGWRNEEFIAALAEHSDLSGKVAILEDVGDLALKQLYDRCLFTLYPSLYEGWGLPVSESLARGVPVVLSAAASLPEVAGDLGVYIPLEDVDRAVEIIRPLIEQPGRLAALRARIRAEYRPDSWSDVAGRVWDACATVG